MKSYKIIELRIELFIEQNVEHVLYLNAKE